MTRLFDATRRGFIALVLTLAAGHAGAQSDAASNNVAATVDYVQGTAFVVRSNGRQSILARGTELREGESINTSRNSAVRVKFRDGGEAVLRPESKLLIKAFQFQTEAPKEDKLQFDLLKGAMRTITGAVGKRGDPDAYKVQVNTTTLGIRGTEYSVRLCQGDCTDVLKASGGEGAAQTVQEPEPGVFLSVHEGSVVLEQSGQSLVLEAGQAAFAGVGQPPVLLPEAPSWLSLDRYLSNSAFHAPICRR